jgi:hypothetical protein
MGGCLLRNKPNCPVGTAAVYLQYNGWKCLSGATP